jgi:sialidase-1
MSLIKTFFWISLLFHFDGFSQQAVPVFISGNEGHKSYRIPAIIRLDRNVLLAFAEGRVHGAGDYGDINIVMKQSKDNGRSWLPLQTIVDVDSLQAGNPAPVVDRTDPLYPNGKIFLYYNTGNNTEAEVRKGNGLREAWYVTSTDNGNTWSLPVNITTMVHRPKQPRVNPEYKYESDWRSYANTPGHAIQFSKGKYAGRMYIAANHSAGGPQPKFTDYHAHGYFTDDHGETFGISDEIPIGGSNESMAAELPGNRLLMNSRNQRGDLKYRIVSISSDGGATWDTTYFDQQLPDPVCQGSLLKVEPKSKETILAFCNAADTLYRNNLTLRLSYDEGKTWSSRFPVDSGQDIKLDHTAYSDLVQISEHEIVVLYERNDYKEIAFKVISIITEVGNR